MVTGVIKITLVVTRTPNSEYFFKYRNSDYCSVFRSELIAIENSLTLVEGITEPDFTTIWILTNRRSSIQHLTNWSEVDVRAVMSNLTLINRLSGNFDVHFQRVSSRVGISGNEMAGISGKASLVTLDSVISYIFSEVFSKEKKSELVETLSGSSLVFEVES